MRHSLTHLISTTTPGMPHNKLSMTLWNISGEEVIPNRILLCNSCNMGVRNLLDMYARSLRATGLKAEDIHIRQITSAHVQVICVTSGTLKICPNLQVFALPIYTTMGIRFNYGIFT